MSKNIPNKSDIKDSLPFGKKNFIVFIASILTLFLGYVVMSLDTQLFGFGFLGLTLGPIITIIGFLLVISAILINPNKND